jgi:transcriptional antiterminator NusG
VKLNGEPVPLRLSEVNRMLGVDELAVNADTVLYFNIGETIKVVDGPLTNFNGVEKLMKKSVN